MDVMKLREGLWRWTARHPDWKPTASWPQEVGCVYYEPRAGGTIVLIDPLAPPGESEDGRKFWTALDRDVARAGLPVTVLVGNEWHGRSADAVLERYRGGPGASIWAHESESGCIDCRPTNQFSGPRTLPGGVEAHPLPALSPGEIAWHIPAHHALVFADAVMGIGGGRVRVAPRSWAGDSVGAGTRYEAEFRPSLRRLADLPVRLLLVSHGECVLEGAREALLEAIDSPGLGE